MSALPEVGARPVALIGLRCVGKTTVGRLLAAARGAEFVDLDEALSKRDARLRGARPPLPAGLLLRALGEPGFRQLEAAALVETLLPGGPGVVATGGGVVTSQAGRAVLASRARCIWLRARPELLASRLRADPTSRPSLLGGDPAEEVRALAARRDSYYAQLAEFALDVDGLTPQELVSKLQSELGS